MTRPRPVPDHIRQAAIATYVAGASLNATSKQHRVSRHKLATWLQIEGLMREPIMPRGGHVKRTSESPAVYRGGWVVRGGVAYPLEPMRDAS